MKLDCKLSFCIELRTTCQPHYGTAEVALEFTGQACPVTNLTVGCPSYIQREGACHCGCTLGHLVYNNNSNSAVASSSNHPSAVPSRGTQRDLRATAAPVCVLRGGPHPSNSHLPGGRPAGLHGTARTPPPSPYVLYGGRYGTCDDGSTGGRAGGPGEGAVWPRVNTKCSS
eukprot:355205-Chlamydomonas_euryale.AAC.1